MGIPLERGRRKATTYGEIYGSGAAWNDGSRQLLRKLAANLVASFFRFQSPCFADKPIPQRPMRNKKRSSAYDLAKTGFMTDAVPHPHAGLIRSLASASAIVAVALGLAGCAATQPKTGEKIDIKDPGKTQTFTFAKATPAGQAIGIDDIKLAVRNAMAGSTPRRDGWDAEQRTVDLNADQSAVVVSSRWAMALNHNSVTMRYPLRVTARGDQYHATLECATVIDWNMLNLSLTGIPQFNMAKVAEDSKAMCENAKPYLPRMAVVRGEVDVEYNSASVFANFRRKLASADLKSWDAYRRAYANANELSIEKAERFLLDVGQGQSPVSISVFPYRNGSKVLYAFGHSFRVDADGTTTYSQAAIDAAKARIKAIAND